MLYVIATPIGNLADISERALLSLRECDYILCEDTRRSSILLQRFGIEKQLVSYHKFTEKERQGKILEDLEAGKKIALVSDAGTPCVNDPGQILVDVCLERGIGVSVVPGPCSVIQALVMSGFETEKFQFLGFLPKKPEGVLKRTFGYEGVSIVFESPERLVRTLELMGERRVAVVREMTKVFEECRRGKASEILEHYRQKPPKGEIVLVIDRGEGVDDLTLEETVEILQELHGLSLKEAIKQAARFKDVAKRDVYRLFHLKGD